MLPSEVRTLLDRWDFGESKVFYYFNNLYAPDIVVLERRDKDLFICARLASSIEIDDLTEEQLSKYLSSNQMKFMEDYIPYRDYRSYRTGGCICGSWIGGPGATHSFWCREHK